MIPIYHSYKEIYLQYLLGKRVHACLTHRYSNDFMFVGNSERLKSIYSEMSKLWILTETLNELFNDNPLWSCETLITDIDYNPELIDDVIKEKYIGYFNKLFTCLKTTIDRLDSKCKISLMALQAECEQSYSIGAGGGDIDPCIYGDYNNDYNDDYFNEICNN